MHCWSYKQTSPRLKPSTMTRGRKALITAPTCTMMNQRNLRARRAQYIANLEERIRQLEAENTQLCIDLEMARTGQATPPQLSAEHLNRLLFSVTLHPDMPKPYSSDDKDDENDG